MTDELADPDSHSREGAAIRRHGLTADEAVHAFLGGVGAVFEAAEAVREAVTRPDRPGLLWDAEGERAVRALLDALDLFDLLTRGERSD